MTVKELEERTGLPRANIRYYEEEGLLAPRRLPNGYRDYSEEDARTLEKIKLLRRLNMDLETIRLVQQGRLTLEQALFGQLNRLEGDRVSIEQAAKVCRELSDSGVGYAALDPAPWLRALEAPARPAVQAPAPPAAPAEQEPELPPYTACWYPWRRYFARAVDMVLYRLLFYGVVLGAFHWYWLLDTPQIVDMLIDLACFALTFALEPLWLHFWGWTPGKWLFGLKLRDENGEKLSLADARERAWSVAWRGYRWTIPIWELVNMWRCRREGLDGLVSDWDLGWDRRYTVEERPGGARLGGAVYIAAQVLFFAVIVLSGFASYLPPVRGPLTVERYVENFNYYAEKFDYGERLSSDGTWLDGRYVLRLTGLHILDPEFTLEDGAVTAVTFRAQSDEALTYLYASHSPEDMGLLALTGALDVGLFDYDPEDWTGLWDEASDPFGDFTLDHRGVRIEQRVETRGLENMGTAGFWPDEDSDEAPYYEKTVTISLIGAG